MPPATVYWAPVTKLAWPEAKKLMTRATSSALPNRLEGTSSLIADELLFRLLRSDAAAAVRAGVGRPADARRIVESMRFIRERHVEKLTVGGLSRRAAMSPSHYAHRFSAVARISPMRYLREVDSIAPARC